MTVEHEPGGDLDVQEYDAEVVTEPTDIDTGEPVDLPEDEDDEPATVYATITGREVDERRPILPAWARSRRDFEAAARWWAGNLWYRTRFHAWHSPKYLAKTLWWAPRGVWVTVRGAWRWASDAEQKPLRKAQIAKDDVQAYLALEKVRGEHVRARMPIFLTGTLAALGATAATMLVVPAPWHALAGAGLTTVLGTVGHPADRPIVGPAIVTSRFRKLTAEQVREALCVIGIAGIKDPATITFPFAIHRDGPGHLARVNLPRGVQAVKVCEARGALSSALRLPQDQVWPSVGPDHDGQLDLWIGYLPASKMRQPKWSLTADNARTSVFEVADFGSDQRQRAIGTELFARNWLIGGVPGSGKSYFARALALAACLDPTVEFKIAEFKGTGDFTDFDDAGLCSAYYCGVDDEALQGGADIIAWGLAEAEKRGKRIKKFRKEGRAPEGKVTPDLAAAGVGLHPVVILIDEAHELLVNKEVAAAAERLIKRGRALNLIVILATQIPDKKSVPPNITRCVTMRACLAVQDHIANDMILGTGAYRAGISATSYRPGIDAGWAMVTGLERPTAVRSQFPTPEAAAKILARAAQLRGGQIVGSDGAEAPRLDVLIDVVRVWPAGRPGVHWQRLAELLAEQRPELYEGVTAESVSSLLRSLDVPSENVNSGGQVLKGCKREAVDAVLERRELVSG
ncbi:AAA family ATPase [Nonomuraea sp. NPDC026600]|uniref:AAA family ATPase n=1 Tax=Nonomuraea sp. NPDC026600 TaxID=3155363 RepID=UPI0033DC11B9